MDRYRGGHGFESHSSLNFFYQALILQLLQRYTNQWRVYIWGSDAYNQNNFFFVHIEKDLLPGGGHITEILRDSSLFSFSRMIAVFAFGLSFTTAAEEQCLPQTRRT